MEERRKIALKGLRIDKQKGLELGPLISPLVTKDEADITYVDHVSTEDLKAKYLNHPIKARPFPVEELVTVDFALNGRTLKQTMRGKKFDYVLASHVIEHIPDTVRWLADVASVMKDGGILSLVIPDKRYTFDILRNQSRPADIIGAYLDNRTQTDSATMYDYMSNFRYNIIADEVWNHPTIDYSQKLKNSDRRVKEACLENSKPGNYVDAHCMVFTPQSFFEIVRVLINEDLFDYEVTSFTDTPQNKLEFYVSLRKSAAPKNKKIRSLPKLNGLIGEYQLARQVASLDEQNQALQASNKQLQTELQALKNSKSWKVTKPLRRVLKATGSGQKK